MTSSIIPAKNDWIPASRIKPQAISVGNLGTRPVFRYSRKTGTNRITETAINNRASIPKSAAACNFVQLHHFTDHTEAIAVGIQLGLTALGTIAVFHHYVFHLHVVVHRVDRHLCLDLESLGKYRERLYKFIAESAIASHDILNVGMKQAVDPRPHQTVAEIVERALVLRK